LLATSAGFAFIAGASVGDCAEAVRLSTGPDAAQSDVAILEGFRRYHAGCNHCHGPDGLGSTFAPSLVDHVIDPDEFRAAVLDGRGNGNGAMQGFASDPNVAPHIDEIYTYLKARAEGAIGRGRPP
jgi:mono/diheme cytochrome c family protein